MKNKSDDTKSYDIHDIMTRKPCPFYGFEMIYEVVAKNCDGRDIMEDAGGDQCAFASIINLPNRSSCLMEAIRDEPKWATCSLNTIENKVKLSKCLEKIRVFPREFRPSGTKEWGGLLLKIWMRHITDTAIKE